jgi:chaperonin GroEL
MAETMERIDDALNATKAAIEQGIIPGGGSALAHCIELSDNDGNHYVSGSMTDGDRLIGNAIMQPAVIIAENAGHYFDYSIILEDESNGFNAMTGEYEDMLAAGIIDPVKVTISALRAAVSIASLVLMTEAAVPLKEAP